MVRDTRLQAGQGVELCGTHVLNHRTARIGQRDEDRALVGRVRLPNHQAPIEERIDLLLDVLTRSPAGARHAWHGVRAAQEQKLEHGPHGDGDFKPLMNILAPALERVDEQAGLGEEGFRRQDWKLSY